VWTAEAVVSLMVEGEAESDAAASGLRSWHELSWLGPAVAFAASFGLWLLAWVVGLWSGNGLVRAAMVLPATLAVGQLFTMGHDAGHGSYSSSRLLNAVVGRLALVPSVHVFGLWRFHHDLHHQFTCLRGRDYVWAPLTVSDYEALPAWRRARHRLYRHGSGVGLGLHYAIEIWAPRMLWPRPRRGARPRGPFLADALFLYGTWAVLVGSAWGFVAVVHPERSGDAGFWLSIGLLLFAIPLLVGQWMIGFVIYLNHTHPDVVWYDDPVEWSRHRVQLDASTGVRFSPWRHWFLPRRIMHHTAHHVDPGVPLRRLRSAQEHLEDHFAERVVAYRWSPTTFCDVLSRCKLYDYRAKRWLTYPPTRDRPR
jgi:omega-6 fatty acid desaturase (delta-12 desaturase)